MKVLRCASKTEGESGARAEYPVYHQNKVVEGVRLVRGAPWKKQDSQQARNRRGGARGTDQLLLLQITVYVKRNAKISSKPGCSVQTERPARIKEPSDGKGAAARLRPEGLA